jgi:hypothetical protein
LGYDEQESGVLIRTGPWRREKEGGELDPSSGPELFNGTTWCDMKIYFFN